MAANTIFIDLDKIKGNATHAKFKDQLALNSFSYSASQGLTDDPAVAQRTTGKKASSDFTLTKETDSSTTELYQYCLFGTIIPKVTLTIGTNTGLMAEWKTIIVYILENVMIRSVSTSGSGSLPTDTFVLNYTKITGTYTKQDVNASAKGNTDFIYNKATADGKG